MNEVIVKFKKLDPNAVIPAYATEDAAGMDITAIGLEYDIQNDRYVYHTGLAFEIPKGYFMDLRPQSRNTKGDFYIPNAPGTLDADYRGELLFMYKRRDNVNPRPFIELDSNTDKGIRAYINSMLAIAPYIPGQTIGQLIILPYPKVKFEEVEELSETKRGEGGFGSTEKK